MKNFKRILTGVLATLVVGSCVSLVPVSADVTYDNLQVVELEEQHCIKYTLPDDFDIQTVIDDTNHKLVINGKSFVLTSIYVGVYDDMGSTESSLSYDVNDKDVLSKVQEDIKNTDTSYGYVIKYVFWIENWKNNPEEKYAVGDYEEGTFIKSKVFEATIPIGASNPNVDTPTVGESSGNPNTEFTVGDSTFPRGDINLDGKVNTVDLLMLKKYLLGLMEW